MALTQRVGLASVLSVLAFACSNEIPAGPGAGGTMAGAGTGGTAGAGGSGTSGIGGGASASGGVSATGGTTSTTGGSAGIASGGTGAVLTVPPECRTTPTPGRSPLRRLTATEYNNTVRDLMGDTTYPADRFPPPEEANGFLNNADAYQTTDLHIEAYFDAAETLAANYRTGGLLNLSCKADAQNCATEFIRDFGKRAFRRPLTDAEVTAYLARFTAGSTGGTFEEGLEWVVGRMLQSPHFLYRIELETEGQTPGTVVPLSNYSIATRLSYFLWSTMPDQTLFAAADAGELSTVEGIAAQVTRMMEHQNFDATLSSFHSQWVGWEHVYATSRVTPTTPAWDTQLNADMIHESELFVKSVFDANGTFADLLTAGHTFVNPRLAEFYGIAYPGAGTEFVRVDNVPHRYGLLTQPSILAGHAHPDQSAPVKRGELVRKHLLCTEPDPPPMGLIINVPEVTPGMTTRQRFEAHRTEASCLGCHVMLDPLGVPFENYDEFGRWRDFDQGLPVDANGGLTLVASLGNVGDPAEAPVSGAQDLGVKLAALPEAQQCLVFNWFRYAMGKVEEATDTCTVTTLIESFSATGNLNDLLVGVATSDGFRYRVEMVTP